MNPQDFIKSAFSDNFWVKVFSLVLTAALFIWVRGDTEETATGYVPIRPDVPDGTVVLSESIERVRLNARGRTSQLDRFDFSKLDPITVKIRMDDNDVPVAIPLDDVETPSGVRIVSAQPSQYTVKFETEITKQVEITPRVVGDPPAPYVVGEITVRPKRL